MIRSAHGSSGSSASDPYPNDPEVAHHVHLDDRFVVLHRPEPDGSGPPYTWVTANALASDWTGLPTGLPGRRSRSPAGTRYLTRYFNITYRRWWDGWERVFSSRIVGR